MKKRIIALVMCIVMIMWPSVTVLADNVLLTANLQEESVQGTSDTSSTVSDSDARQTEETDDENETESGFDVTKGDDSQDTHNPDLSDDSSIAEDSYDSDSTDSNVEAEKDTSSEDAVDTDSNTESEEDKEPGLVGASIIYSEACGDNATWQLENDGTLRVTGTGDMYPYYTLSSKNTFSSMNWDGDETTRFSPWVKNDYTSIVTRIVVEEGITSIGQGAFVHLGNYRDDSDHFQYGSVRSIQLPSSLEKISNGAFGLVKCNELAVPGGTEIRPYAFDYCRIENISFEEGITRIPEYAFHGFIGKEVVLPDTVTEIGKCAFEYNSTLQTIYLPSNLKIIGEKAFFGCNNLKNIELPEGLETINADAFSSSALEGDITIPSTVTTIKQRAFACTNITSVSFLNDEVSLGYSVFNQCYNLVSVDLPQSIEIIPSSLFSACSSLKNIRLPETVKQIEGGAFSGCVSLTEIDIPDSVEIIKADAFNMCTGLQSVLLPKSLTYIYVDDIYEGNGGPAFNQCNNLTEITVAEDNEVYRSYDGCLYNKSKDTLLYIPEGKTEVNVANTVEQVKRCLFNGVVLRFYDNAPTFSENAFLGVNATIYYPGNNDTWTEVIEDNYDGTVTWIPWDVPAPVTDINACTATLSSTSYTYNGKAKKPSVTVKDGSVALTLGIDYTVDYSDNTDAGTATVTITGIGNYTGSLSKTFTINQAAPKLTFASSNVSKTTQDAAFTNTLTKTTDGSVTFKSSNTSVATVNSTTGKVTIKGAGTTTITATAAAGTNYKAGSAQYTLTVTESLKIVSISDDFYGKTGTQASFHIEAEGSGTITYQWQYRTAGMTSWKAPAKASAKTEDYTFGLKPSYDNIEVRCIISDDSGRQVISETRKANVFAILSQPDDVTAPEGQRVVFEVSAIGRGVTYQWYYMRPNGVWNVTTISGSRTAVLPITAGTKNDGTSYRCVITDEEGNQITSAAGVLTMDNSLRITGISEDAYGKSGESVTFHIDAVGNGALSYQWQYKLAGETKWRTPGKAQVSAKTADYAFKLTPSYDNIEVRCIVKDEAGNTCTSDVRKANVFAITKQPELVIAELGERVTFSVEGIGKNLTYQWYYRRLEGGWNKVTTAGHNTASLTVTAQVRNNASQYRCYVYDGLGNLIKSQAAMLIEENEDYEG